MRFLAVLALAATALPAQAQVTGDPDVIQLLMQDAGYQVSRTTDSVGDPLLETQQGDIRFGVYFYNCERICDSIQFAAGFDLSRPMTATRANEWNRDRRYGKVYLDDEGDPWLEMDVGLAEDGIGRKNFLDALDTWRVVLDEFDEFIDW